MNYCTNCEHRNHTKTNEKDFCKLGYKQNPLSLQATVNALKNKGKVCSINPFKTEAYLWKMKSVVGDGKKTQTLI